MSLVKNTYGQFLDLLYKVDKGTYKKWRFRKIDRLTWDNVESMGHEPELLVVEEITRQNPDFVFLDVGCFIGAYVRIALKNLKQENVYAFEPNPILNERLRELFPGVSINANALSEKEYKGRIKIPFINNSKFAPRATLNTDFVEDGETGKKFYDVEVTTLDYFVKNRNLERVDLIKIDVEGHEFEAIKGGAEILQKFHPILIVEIEERHHPEEGTKQIFDFLESKGYKTYFLNNRNHVIEPLEHGDLENLQKAENFKTEDYINNFIFIPQDENSIALLESVNSSISKFVKG